MLMVLEDESTWPGELRDVLLENEPVLRAFEEEETRIFNDDSRDGRYLPWALRGPNRFWDQRQHVVKLIEATFEDSRLQGYHCTRFTDVEVEDIIADGMMPPSPVMLKDRIRRLQQDGTIDASIADRLIGENQTHEPTRMGRIWFVFTSAPLRERWGAGDFFRYWGGEALYNMHDKETGRAVRAVGEARIIVAAVAAVELSNRDRLADVAARRFLVNRGLGSATDLDYEGYVKRPMPAAQICQMISKSEDIFELLAGYGKWTPPLT